MKLKEAIHSEKLKDDAQTVAINIMHTAYLIKYQLNDLFKQYALTSEQYNILRILKGAFPEKLCVKQISERLIERSANVPRTMDRLVLKQLVRRSTSKADKRETVAEITTAGIHLLDSIAPALDRENKNMCKLQDAQIAVLNQLLDDYRG